WRSLNQNWYRSGQPYADLSRIDGQANPLFQEWLQHPSYDRYWQAMIPYGKQFAHLDLPVLSVSGYFDQNEPGSLYYFDQHTHFDPQANETFVIGPYDDALMSGPPPALLRGYQLDVAALINWHVLRYQWFD